jgi:hypothetical protein
MSGPPLQPDTYGMQHSTTDGRDIMLMEDPTEDLALTEQDLVERWRSHELERVGFDIVLARTLACRLDVDLHQALDLIGRGCPHELAARILL